MGSVPRKRMPPRSTRIPPLCFIVGAAFVIVVLLLASIHNSKTTTAKLKPQQRFDSSKGDKNISSKLTQGVAGNVAYYHCSGAVDDNNARKVGKHEAPNSQTQSLVLLHGAKFTKEDWKSSGILSSLCNSPPRSYELSVVALDLPVEANHGELIVVLDDLENANLVTKPVTLVTPSASGKCMVDWLQHQNEASSTQTLDRYIKRWIPIASGAIQHLTKIHMVGSLSVLAVYGDRDRNGKIVSERLQEIAAPTTNVQVLEMKGGHACYLDSPSAFVDAVLGFLPNT